jgi:hypothetical protein
LESDVDDVDDDDDDDDDDAFVLLFYWELAALFLLRSCLLSFMFRPDSQ